MVVLISPEKHNNYRFQYVIVLIIIDSYNIFYLRYIELNLLYLGIASGWPNTESTWNCLDGLLSKCKIAIAYYIFYKTLRIYSQ